MKISVVFFLGLFGSVSAFSAALECKRLSATSDTLPPTLHMNPLGNSIRGPEATESKPHSAFAIRTIVSMSQEKEISGLVKYSKTCPRDCEFFTLKIKPGGLADLTIAQEHKKPTATGHYKCDTIQIDELATPAKFPKKSGATN